MKIIQNQNGVIEITPDENMVLTCYVDGEDLAEYIGISKMYCKSLSSVSNLREITEEQHRSYMQERSEAISKKAEETVENTLVDEQ